MKTQEIREAWRVLVGDGGIRDLLQEHRDLEQAVERLTEEKAALEAELGAERAKINTDLAAALVEFKAAHAEAGKPRNKTTDLTSALTRVTAATKAVLAALGDDS